MGHRLFSQQNRYLSLRRLPSYDPPAKGYWATERRDIKYGIIDPADELGYQNAWETELQV